VCVCVCVCFHVFIAISLSYLSKASCNCLYRSPCDVAASHIPLVCLRNASTPVQVCARTERSSVFPFFCQFNAVSNRGVDAMTPASRLQRLRRPRVYQSPWFIDDVRRTPMEGSLLDQAIDSSSVTRRNDAAMASCSQPYNTTSSPYSSV